MSKEIETENFRICGNKIIYTGNKGGNFVWGRIDFDATSGVFGYRPMIVDCPDPGIETGFHHSGVLGEIKDLIDMLSASVLKDK